MARTATAVVIASMTSRRRKGQAKVGYEGLGEPGRLPSPASESTVRIGADAVAGSEVSAASRRGRSIPTDATTNVTSTASRYDPSTWPLAWWRVAARELPTGLLLGALLGAIGFIRVELWQYMHDAGMHLGSFGLGYDYTQQGTPSVLVALNTFLALVGIVTFGSMAGSMLPFLLRRMGFDPASASAPFVATLVDVSGLVIYFTVALLVLGKFMG